MLKGFKDFIMRGNLVELAVAFVMALAFAAVVTATVTLLMELIGKIFGQPDFTGWRPGDLGIGAWITAVISFVILAAVVYFVIVVPYNKLTERMARGQEESPEPPAEDVALLTEIRDLLAAQRGSAPSGGAPGSTV
ncbi:MAG: large conductance mechanosensitive channel protein MscL [Nocardioidaceae bacterium]